MADYLVGEYVRLSLSLLDFAGNPADPGALRLRVRSGAGVLSAYAYGSAPEVVRDGLGLYHADLPLSVAGSWYYRWESDAPNSGACEGAFPVFASRVLL